MEHIGRTALVTVGGKTYKLSRYSRKMHAEFLKWAATMIPHPLAGLWDRIKDFPPNIQEKLVENARLESRLHLTEESPEVASLKKTPEGLIKILTLLFQENHPELTDADVGRLFDQCGEEHGYDYLAKKVKEAEGVVTEPEDARIKKKDKRK